jgi:heme A synthase
MRWLAASAFIVVVLQALIGGLRVLIPSAKPVIAVPHALVAQSFFCLIVALAALTSRSWQSRRAVTTDSASAPLRSLATATVGVVLVQLVLGAAFRHGAIGIVPHITGAVVVTILASITVVRTVRTGARDPYLTRPAWTAMGLLIIQLALGVLAYLARLASRSDPQPLEPMISLTVMHVIVGALTLATLLALALRVRQVVRPDRTESAGEPIEMLARGVGA